MLTQQDIPLASALRAFLKKISRVKSEIFCYKGKEYDINGKEGAVTARELGLANDDILVIRPIIQ